VKSYEEVMNILEAFDLTGSFRDAAELAGCSHHTVAGWVAKRDAGLLGVPGEVSERSKLIDGFLPKVEEWVERSHGKIRADVAFDKLVALGFAGSDRTARRAVARCKENYRRGRRRVYRPWIAEPGMWAQWDWGQGPTIGGRGTNLFCAWLGWCRFRVVIPTWDRTLPTVIGCLDRAMRSFGGAPTYWLTDNEKTVTVDHVAGIAVRHPTIVAAGGHYGVTVATCVPYDARDHRATRRAPDAMLAEERQRLHRLPEVGYTAVFGQTRKVSWSATISYGGVTYSVPHTLAETEVWARVEGDELVITHLAGRGATEVARHLLSTPGNPRIDDAHYPPRPSGPLNRTPKATNPAERAFLDLGDGARMWLIEAGAAGAARVKTKMADAVELAALHGPERVDWALGHAATFGRFDDGATASILTAHPAGTTRRASGDHSLQDGTSGWEGFGQ